MNISCHEPEMPHWLIDICKCGISPFLFFSSQFFTLPSLLSADSCIRHLCKSNFSSEKLTPKKYVLLSPVVIDSAAVPVYNNTILKF